MAQEINETSTFRQRGYKDPTTGAITEVFGNDPAPVNPDGSVFVLEWDHMVSTKTVVTDYVAPAVSGAV